MNSTIEEFDALVAQEYAEIREWQEQEALAEIQKICQMYRDKIISAFELGRTMTAIWDLRSQRRKDYKKFLQEEMRKKRVATLRKLKKVTYVEID